MYILAIDQGTTGTRACLVGRDGAVAAQAYREFTQHFPRPGWVEHDAEEIWQTVVGTVGEVAGRAPGPIAAVGITNQRETTVLWDRTTGQPLHRAIVWQCRRTAALCDALRPHEARFRERTGLPLDPYFSGTKLRWLLDHLDHPPATDRLAFGTIDSWLVWKLTGGRRHVTDCTNASRTLLYDIHARRWDPELCRLLGVPASLLPDVLPPVAEFGTVSTIPALSGVPITGVAGDQQAALFGQTGFDRGGIKNTFGTGGFAILNTGPEPVNSTHGLITTLAADATGRPCYALEGSVFVAGAAVQWLRDGLGLLGRSAESEALAASLPDNGGVYLVPAFVGLGAPHWDMEARGTLVGLTRGTTRAHLVRAALEAMAYQTVDVLQAMEQDSGVPIASLAVDGGAAANDWLLQFQADVLGCQVERPAVTESTALGAAFLAGLGAGLWRQADDLRSLRRVERVFLPGLGPDQRQALLAGWRRAVRQARTR